MKSKLLKGIVAVALTGAVVFTGITWNGAQSIQTIKTQMEEAVSIIDALKANATKLEEIIARKNEEILQLVNSGNSSSAEDKAKIEELTNEVTSLQAQVDEANARIAEYEEALAELEQEYQSKGEEANTIIAKLNEEVQRLEGELEKANNDIASLLAENTALYDSIKDTDTSFDPSKYEVDYQITWGDGNESSSEITGDPTGNEGQTSVNYLMSTFTETISTSAELNYAEPVSTEWVREKTNVIMAYINANNMMEDIVYCYRIDYTMVNGTAKPILYLAKADGTMLTENETAACAVVSINYFINVFENAIFDNPMYYYSAAYMDAYVWYTVTGTKNLQYSSYVTEGRINQAGEFIAANSGISDIKVFEFYYNSYSYGSSNPSNIKVCHADGRALLDEELARCFLTPEQYEQVAMNAVENLNDNFTDITTGNAAFPVPDMK